jgi:hypothetical protein
VSRTDETVATIAANISSSALGHRASSWQGKLSTWSRRDYEPGQVTEVSIAYKSDFTAAVAAKIYAVEYDIGSDNTILTLQQTGTVLPCITRPYATMSKESQQVAATSRLTAKVDVQRSDSAFDLQADKYVEEDFGSSWEDEAAQSLGGASTYFTITPGTGIVAINDNGDWTGGNTLECYPTAYSPTGSDGKDNVLFWWLTNFVKTDNDGSVAVYIEEETTLNRSAAISDWVDLTGNLGGSLTGGCDKTKKYRIVVEMTWDPVDGNAPSFEMGAIRWK